MSHLSIQGFLLRFIFALILVLITYNPSGHSYYHWVLETLPAVTPYIVLAGLALLIGWAIYLRATLRSLGLVGIILVVAVCGCILWLLFDMGIVSAEKSSLVAWIVLFFQALILTVGMSWSHIRRRLSGQIDGDDVDEN